MLTEWGEDEKAKKKKTGSLNVTSNQGRMWAHFVSVSVYTTHSQTGLIPRLAPSSLGVWSWASFQGVARPAYHWLKCRDRYVPSREEGVIRKWLKWSEQVAVFHALSNQLHAQYFVCVKVHPTSWLSIANQDMLTAWGEDEKAKKMAASPSPGTKVGCGPIPS